MHTMYTKSVVRMLYRYFSTADEDIEGEDVVNFFSDKELRRIFPKFKERINFKRLI